MGGNRQIARLRVRARRADELVAKLERINDRSETMRKVIANIRSESQHLWAHITFLEIAEKHGGHWFS
jgi:hypothetical protein